MNYGNLLTNVYTRKKLGHITQHQSCLYRTNDVSNDVILTNHRVCTMMTLNISRMNTNPGFSHRPRIPFVRRRQFLTRSRSGRVAEAL